jgi:hypothetical protein
VGVLSWLERRREPIVEERPWNDPALDAALDRMPALLQGDVLTEHVLGHLRQLRGQVEKHAQATRAFAERLTTSLDLLRWRVAQAGDDAETAADARTLLGEALVARGWEVRTSDRAHTVSQDQWRRFGILLGEADEALVSALDARPYHPAAATARLRVALGVGLDSADEWWERFEVAVHDRATLYPAHTLMLSSMCRKWYGSDEIMFDFARKAAASAPPGDPVSAVLPMAHVEFLLSTAMFDHPSGEQAARAEREADLATVVEASRRWCGDGTSPMPQHPRDVEAHQLFGWFLGADKAHADRARWHLEQAGTRMSFLPWAYLPPNPEWSFRNLRSRLRVAR